jgi:hypothetical protein
VPRPGRGEARGDEREAGGGQPGPVRAAEVGETGADGVRRPVQDEDDQAGGRKRRADGEQGPSGYAFDVVIVLSRA